MKIILTAALAASLLGGTAAMAQPGDNSRDHGKNGEQTDRKDRKTEDRNANRDTPPDNGAPRALSAPQPAAPERAADARQQGRDDRNQTRAQFNQPAPAAPAAPERAADARQQGPTDRNQASARFTQPAPVAPAAPERAADARQQGPTDRGQAAARFNQPAPAAPSQSPREAFSSREQAGRMSAQQQQAQPQFQGRNPAMTNNVAAPYQGQPAARFNQPAPVQPAPAPQSPREAYSGRGQAGPVSTQQSYQQPQFQGRNPAITNNAAAPSQANRWARGDRVPDQYRQNQYYVNDWQQHGLRQPPGGYRWVRDDNNDFFLSLMATGIIADAVYRSDRDDRWRERYSRSYDYNDDVYYQQCRRSPDPAGILAGGLIGGLVGNAAGHGRSGPTIAGVIFGGAIGAALTSNMDCEDRSYAYRTYYNGFNSGRYGERYEWRNPRNHHRGEFRIRSYYNDPYGFRCARFTQVTYVQNRSFNVRGIACRQPDGSWAVVN